MSGNSPLDYPNPVLEEVGTLKGINPTAGDAVPNYAQPTGEVLDAVKCINVISCDAVPNNDQSTEKVVDALLAADGILTRKSRKDEGIVLNSSGSTLIEAESSKDTDMMLGKIVSLRYAELMLDEALHSKLDEATPSHIAKPTTVVFPMSDGISEDVNALLNADGTLPRKQIPRKDGGIAMNNKCSTLIEVGSSNNIDLMLDEIISSSYAEHILDDELQSKRPEPASNEATSSHLAQPTSDVLANLEEVSGAVNTLFTRSGVLPRKQFPRRDERYALNIRGSTLLEAGSSNDINLILDEIISSSYAELSSAEPLHSKHFEPPSDKTKSSHLAKPTPDVFTTPVGVCSNNIELTSNEVTSPNIDDLTLDDVISFTSSNSSTSIKFTTSIQDLPNEILEHIFTFLDIQQRIKTESVCKRWRLIGAEMHWTFPIQLRLGVYFDQLKNCKLNDNVLCAILSRCGRSLREFALSTYNSDITLNSLMKIGGYCPHVVSIALHLHESENACLKAIAVGCPYLKLVQVDSFEDSQYNEGIFTIVDKCKALECLYVTNLQVTGDWMTMINPHMKTLSLNCCRVMPYAVVNLIARCDRLNELVLKKCTSLEPDLLSKTFNHFRHTLTDLRVIHHPQVLDWGKLLSGLKNLESLHLFGCNTVDDSLMVVLAENCIKIQVLDIGASMVTDEGLLSLKRLPGLKRLNVSLAYRIIGYGLEVLCAKGVLEQVTLLHSKDVLKEACSIIAVMYPKVHFVTE